MNGAHLHLLVNHLPIMGSFIAIPLVILALWKNKDASFLTAAVVVLVIAALGAIAADSTGGGAAHVVKDLPNVMKSAIRVHADRAGNAEVLSIVTALLGGGMLFWRMRKADAVPRLALAGLLVASLVTAVAMGAVGAAGGVIHHPEIRGDALNSGIGDGTVNGPGGGEAGPPAGADGDDDVKGEK